MQIKEVKFEKQLLNVLEIVNRKVKENLIHKD